MVIAELDAVPRGLTPEQLRSTAAQSLMSEDINEKRKPEYVRLTLLRHGEPHFFFVRNEPELRAVGPVFP